MSKYKRMGKGDWIKIIVYITLLIGVITIGGIFLLPSYFYIWLILTSGSMLLFIRWHIRTFAYKCSRCGCEFEISLLTYFINPHGPGWKYLKCPECKKRSRATLVRKMEKS